MKPITKITTILGAILVLMLINICEAKAELPPEPWHCASQEQCFALLTTSGVSVTREGTTKGTITGMGTGDGNIAVSEGVIMVTRNNDTNLYMYDVLTETTCSIDVQSHCIPGVVATFVEGDSALIVCEDNKYRRIPLDCSTYYYSSMSGLNPNSVVKSDTNIFIGFADSGNIGVMTPPSSAVGSRISDFTGTTSLVYHEGTDSVYMNTPDAQGIYVKAVPIAHGAATLFQSIPADTTYMSGSNSHMAISGDVWNGYILDFNNPTSYVTVTLDNPTENAISPATPGEPVRAYFIDIESAGVRIRIFDETGTEVSFSPLTTGSWDVAYIPPTLPPTCNDGLFEPGETCDSTDFDGLDCTDFGFDGGALSCSASCDQIFTSGCWSCGDGTLNPGESCDGTDLGTGTCQDGGFASGSISCNTDCTYNYDQCYTCGNSLIEGAEQCEGADLDGADCTTEGFVSGTLACGTDCMYDVSGCSACGDNIANYSETCDGTDIPDMICQTMGLGYTGGTLGCNSACDGYDDSGCYTCGDGNVDLTEECDGVNLDNQDCGTIGLGSGALSCFEDCTFNLTQCSDVPAEYCGNGTIDPGEECDDGNRSNNDDCSEFCKIIPPTCGLGGVDAGEECDGEDLNGTTCESLGYQAGVLYCGGDCRFRTYDCHFTSTPQTISLTLDAEPESGELNESLQSQYENLKATLTPNCISQDVNGDLVLTTTQGSYCAARATVIGEDKTVFSFIYMPENALEDELPVLRFYKTGDIAQNFGGNITAYKGLQVKTVLVQDRLYQVTQERFASMGMKFLAVHPETQSRGRWLALNIGTGSTSMCTDDQGENCAHLVPQQGQVIINLDVLDDLSKIDWKPPKDGGGCSCSTGSNSSNSLPLLLMLGMAFLFWNRRNHMK